MLRRLLPASALVLTLAVAGCGSETPGSAEEFAAVSADQQAVAGTLAQDLRPLHAEAVELAGLVLAASPDTEVAGLARRISDGQQSLLAEVDGLLTGAGSTPSEAGALTAQELAAVRAAAGNDAVTLGLDGLLRNHLAALNRAKSEATEEGAQTELANRVLDEQGVALAEISQVQRPG